MRAPHSILTLLLATATLPVAGTACRPEVESRVSADASTRVMVVNNNFSDINIFAEGRGTGRRRLGMVVGQTSATFRLPSNYAAFGELELFGLPIGGFGSAESGTVSIGPGQLVVFTLQADLGLSTVAVEAP